MSAPEEVPDTQGASRVDPEIRHELMQMMTEFLENWESWQCPLQHSSATPGASGSSMSQAMETNTTSLKASEIGYFFPNMPLDWGDKDVIEKDGKMYYRNVFRFTNRNRCLSQQRHTSKLKQ